MPEGLVAHKLGSSLASVRREWPSADPSVRRGQGQVDEDEVQLQLIEKNAFILVFAVPRSTIDSCPLFVAR